MTKAYTIVSIVYLVAIIAACFFTNCSIDIIAIVVAAVLLAGSVLLNIKTVKKMFGNK